MATMSPPMMAIGPQNTLRVSGIMARTAALPRAPVADRLLRHGGLVGLAVFIGLSSPIICVSYNELSSPLILPMTHSQAPAPKPRRGRPRDPARGRRILEAAQRHFNEHGLERANVDAIAADAGVSKMTVYNNFGSKEGLFQAFVRDRTAPVVAGVPGAEALDPEQPEKALQAIGARFLAL
ncbi:MAG TPA: TetR/AcrR family transcriptional regulator, partial [Allosphingosinicella sp.]|nr:TetR/AcrR family transcriptional regulator [Allosphingosinicella sp.]